MRTRVDSIILVAAQCIKKNPDVAKTLGLTVRKLTIIVGEVAGNLEKLAEVPVTDWMAIGDAIVSKLEQVIYAHKNLRLCFVHVKSFVRIFFLS